MSVSNVLLITVDSLRAKPFLRDDARDALTIFDQIENTQGGTVFSRAFATGPGTTPSFPALMTGTYPLSMGGFEPLSRDRPFVADRLQTAGMETAGFTSNPFLSTSFNYDTGFNTFQDYQNPLMGFATKLFPRGIEDGSGPLHKLNEYTHALDIVKKAYETVSGKARPYVPANVISTDGIDWLETVESPFFGWFHYMDVHHPCYPPQEYRDRFGVDPAIDVSTVSDLYSSMVSAPDELDDSDINTLLNLYGASIAYVNDQIERVFDVLRRNGMWKDTMVIVTSDHGELFGEHGKYAKPEYLYDELLQVPLVMTNVPADIAVGSDDLVSLIDIPPVIHKVLSIENESQYDGQLPGINPRQYVLAEHKRDDSVIVGARSNDWRYVHDEIRDADRLFNVETGERVSISSWDDKTNLRSAVQQRLDAISLDTDTVDLDSDVEQRLRNLGYK